jgi:FkbM family methyltransferase
VSKIKTLILSSLTLILLSFYGGKKFAEVKYKPEIVERKLSDEDIANLQINNSQFGEDLIIGHLLNFLFSKDSHGITYLDIGANHPFHISNTYFFYRRGGKGVLIEPNPNLKEVIERVRPNDVLLNVGVAFKKGQKSATYYAFNFVYGPSGGELNTFLKTRAEELQKGHPARNMTTFECEKEIPLVDINEVLLKYFSDKELDLLSIDIEGLDMDVLQLIDYKRFRPKLICVESSKVDYTYDSKSEIEEFFKSKGYVLVGDTFTNKIFGDLAQMKQHRPWNMDSDEFEQQMKRFKAKMHEIAKES